MPAVEISTGRWRWGRHGAVYRSKAQAERQGRAILASGWREDSPRGRQAKREMHLALSPSRRAENGYVRELVSIVRGVHRGVMALVDEHLPTEGEPRVEDLRADARELARVWDALKGAWRTLGDRIAKHLAPRVGVAFETMAKKVDQKGARSSTLIGIRPNAPGVQAAIAQARDRNIALIQDTGGQFIDQVRGVLQDPDNEGLRWEEIRDKLQERADVSLSRATLIARDQTTKLSGALNQARQVAAGVEYAIWSTSMDERVREEHRALDGQRFSIVNGLDGDLAAMSGEEVGAIPGSPINCRCVAIAITSDEEEVASAPEEDEQDLD